MKEDKTLIDFVMWMKRIEDTHDSDYIIHNLGKIYNDAINYLVVTYQIDGDTAIKIIDEYIDEYGKQSS